MSTKGRPRKPIKVDPIDDSKLDVSPAAIQAELEEAKRPKAAKPRPQDPAVFQRNVADARSRIDVIIDVLEGDDEDASLKRRVATALKHLKHIAELLKQQ